MLPLLPLAFLLAGPAPAQVDLSYLTPDRERLAPAAQETLERYLRRPWAWDDLAAGLAKLGAPRVIGLGESHGAPGHDELVARALEIGKPAGVDTLLLEMDVSCQAALDRYARGELDHAGLMKEAGCYADYTPKTIETARRLGIRIVAIDKRDAPDRNRFMHDRSVEALNHANRAILYCGAEHIYSAFDLHLEGPTLGLLLKRLLGDDYVSIKMLADTYSAPVKRAGLPRQAIIATAGSPVAAIPEDWILDGKSTTWWRFGDFDYLAAP